jgi:hypothetical protein
LTHLNVKMLKTTNNTFEIDQCVKGYNNIAQSTSKCMATTQNYILQISILCPLNLIVHIIILSLLKSQDLWSFETNHHYYKNKLF